MDRPKLTLDQLATITDDQQITDIRAAAELALATFDAWRQSPDWNAREKHYQRWGVLVDRVALVLAEPSTDAELRTVIDAVGPLLNSWFPSSREPDPVRRGRLLYRTAVLNGLGTLALDYAKRPVSHPARCTGRSVPVCARP